ncbi:MAG: cytochrome c oxidase subunit II [Rickettsiales bacterium]
MTQKSFMFLRSFTFVALAAVLLALPQYTVAAEGTPITAVPRAEVEQTSEKVNAEKGSEAAKDIPGAKKDETHTGTDTLVSPDKAPEKPLSEAEKKAAIADADALTSFDPAKLVGVAKPWQVYYQESNAPVMDKLVPLHDAVLVIITLITIFVLVLLIYVCVKFSRRANPKPQTFTHNKTVEIVWTVIPILILVGIAIPSLRLHYNYYNNEQIISNPDLTVKVVGHQWYWEYEYPDQAIKFDSNMTKTEDLPEGAPRLLEVDNPLVVPVGKVVRIQLTSADVIHAFALPSFGIKKGAVPGRLNETWFKADKEGVYYGQCSVLCGKLHGFMPIKIVVLSEEEFETWAKGAKLKFASNDSMQFAALNQ